MSEEPTSIFTPTQRRIVGGSLVLLAFGAATAATIYGLILLGNLVSYFSSVLWPLAVAGVLALILRPIISNLERFFRLHRSAAVIVLFGAFVLLATAIIVLIVPPLIDQILDFISYAPILAENVSGYVQLHYPEWIALVQRQLENPPVHQAIERIMGELQTMLTHALPSLRAAGGGLVDLMAFLTHLAIIPVYLFFFLLARGEPIRRVKPNLPFLRAGVRDDVIFLLREFVGIVESFFRGQLIIGLIMGVLLALGFTLIGLRFGLIIGLVVGVLNIIPYLGTIVSLVVTLPLAFFQPDGGWRLVALVLLVKVLVQLVESWVLTPKIMGDRTGLHPVTIIVAIFFWGTVFHGVLGMLLAIPLTAFFVTAWRLLKQKYFKPDHA